MNNEVFAKRLKEARENKGIRQNTLAKAVGVTPQTISGYERKDGLKTPSLDIAADLARELGVSLDWLLGLADATAHKARFETLADVVETIEEIMDITGGDAEIHSVSIEGSTSQYVTVAFYDDAIAWYFSYKEKLGDLIKASDDTSTNNMLYDTWREGAFNQLRAWKVHPTGVIYRDDSTPTDNSDMPF